MDCNFTHSVCGTVFFICKDTWKEDLIFHKDAFDLLQNILEDSDVLKERVPYEALVTTEFAEKATAR